MPLAIVAVHSHLHYHLDPFRIRSVEKGHLAMYVCICNAVTDREIEAAVDAGARRLRDLRRGLGVAGRCGKCAAQAKDILQARKAELEVPFEFDAALA